MNSVQLYRLSKQWSKYLSSQNIIDYKVKRKKNKKNVVLALIFEKCTV